MIAMAISCRPSLLIADEPTTALDVTIQAQILDLLASLQKEEGMSILLITHDLGVVGERSDDVAVMYASRVAEMVPQRDTCRASTSLYTRSASVPAANGDRAKRLPVIPGSVPDPREFPPGCKFHPRCR